MMSPSYRCDAHKRFEVKSLVFVTASREEFS